MQGLEARTGTAKRIRYRWELSRLEPRYLTETSATSLDIGEDSSFIYTAAREDAEKLALRGNKMPVVSKEAPRVGALFGLGLGPMTLYGLALLTGYSESDIPTVAVACAMPIGAILGGLIVYSSRSVYNRVYDEIKLAIHNNAKSRRPEKNAKLI